MPARRVDPNSLVPFEKSLKSGKAVEVSAYNNDYSESVWVRALGHISPDQFHHTAMPSVYGRTWEDASSNPDLGDNVDYSMDDLASNIKERGMQRPVIISRTKMYGEKRVMDGHHRIIAAMRVGATIPTYELDEKLDGR